MRPFRATYTPYKGRACGKPGATYTVYDDDPDNARTVLIVAILMESEKDAAERAIFIDSDNSLKSAYLDRFTNCQSSEWGEQ